ncbi:LOW QUALITY PROTEIN: Kinesin motor domain [Dillenia turbinata]|uniref:Kinesin-like protein n=1 Tax=Dillenia turbinata TaxID=194707 RepID=A0AAN8W5N9_9MAGN
MNFYGAFKIFTAENCEFDNHIISHNAGSGEMNISKLPLNGDEKSMKSNVVNSCDEIKRVVSVIHNSTHKKINRTFIFDKVFGPTAQQKELYDEVVSPIVNDVLERYNCTVFTYGQTGMGKTYKMEGKEFNASFLNGELSNNAGVIPRAVKQILEAQNADYSMTDTFLVLYNEEITNLLASDDSSKLLDERLRNPNSYGRGQWGCLCERPRRGRGCKKACCRNSSQHCGRSHSIFSITIHIRESVLEGDELIKCGKLNLVDLAGSENISRREKEAFPAILFSRCSIINLLNAPTRLQPLSLFGACNWTGTRETGDINKSFFTLGHIINELVECSAHVPYRLIRRWKKIALVKDLYKVIARVKQELNFRRMNNGIYMPQDHYLIEESEKEPMVKMMSFMLLDSDSKDKSKLNTLSDIEDRRNQENTTLKEKEKSEKELIEHAQNLGSRLENATSPGPEQQLKVMEDDAQLLISTKEEATALLQKHIEQLRSKQDSCIRSLDDLAGELNRNSQLTYENMSTEVSKHASSPEDLFRILCIVATALLDDLQYNLQSKQKWLAAFGKQLHKSHSRSMDAMQSISEAMECATHEARKLLEKNSRTAGKLKCCQEKAGLGGELRENVASRTCKFH